MRRLIAGSIVAVVVVLVGSILAGGCTRIENHYHYDPAGKPVTTTTP